MPTLLSQVKEALGPSSIPVVAPDAAAAPVVAVALAAALLAIASTSKAPPIPVPVPVQSAAYSFIVEDSDSDPDVQTLAVPFHSGSLDMFIPMVSVDEAWISDAEFRFIASFILYCLFFFE